MRVKPSMEEPSKRIWWSRAFSNWLRGTSTFLMIPIRSVNWRRRNLTRSSSAIFRMSRASKCPPNRAGRADHRMIVDRFQVEMCRVMDKSCMNCTILCASGSICGAFGLYRTAQDWRVCIDVPFAAGSGRGTRLPRGFPPAPQGGRRREALRAGRPRPEPLVRASAADSWEIPCRSGNGNRTRGAYPRAPQAEALLVVPLRLEPHVRASAGHFRESPAGPGNGSRMPGAYPPAPQGRRPSGWALHAWSLSSARVRTRFKSAPGAGQGTR